MTHRSMVSSSAVWFSSGQAYTRTDRQTDRQTDVLITIICTSPGSEVKIYEETYHFFEGLSCLIQSLAARTHFHKFAVHEQDKRVRVAYT